MVGIGAREGCVVRKEAVCCWGRRESVVGEDRTESVFFLFFLRGWSVVVW